MKGDPEVEAQTEREAGEAEVEEWEVQGVEAKEGEGPVRGRAGAAACATRGGAGAAFGAWGL